MFAVIGALFVLGLIVKYWWFVVGVVALRWGIPRLRATLAAQRVAAEALAMAQAAVALRADQQHSWALAGDPRGTFGEHFTALPD